MTAWQERPFAPARGAFVCRDDGGDFVREVQFGDGKDTFSLLVIRHGVALRAYRNACPHFGVPLNAEPGEFHRFDDLIMCAHHSSMFRISDGYCEDGPCAGATMEAVPVAVIEGDIRIA